MTRAESDELTGKVVLFIVAMGFVLGSQWLREKPEHKPEKPATYGFTVKGWVR